MTFVSWVWGVLTRKAADTIRCRSNLSIDVFDLQGNLVSHEEVHNAWSSAGLDAIRNWAYGDAITGFTHVAWTDSTDNERVREAITQRIKSDTNELTIKQYLSSTTGNGYTYDTVTVYNASSGGTAFASAEFTGIEKTASIQITITWVFTWSDN